MDEDTRFLTEKEEDAASELAQVSSLSHVEKLHLSNIFKSLQSLEVMQVQRAAFLEQAETLNEGGHAKEAVQVLRDNAEKLSANIRMMAQALETYPSYETLQPLARMLLTRKEEVSLSSSLVYPSSLVLTTGE